jgi:hypothetical protein
MSTDTPQAETFATEQPWSKVFLYLINKAFGVGFADDAAPGVVANSIIEAFDRINEQGLTLRSERDNLRIELNTVRAERDNSRALNNQLLDAERVYRQTLADRLGVPCDTAKDAAALCDALAPRLAIEAAASDAVNFLVTALPDVLSLDDDGHPPMPAHTIVMLFEVLRSARRDIARTNEALNVARAEADALRSTLAATQADLRATDRARDSWRDAAGASARALSLAASALADVAAIR